MYYEYNLNTFQLPFESPYDGYRKSVVSPTIFKDQSDWLSKINKYVLRALAYIQSILQLLRSCSPFFKQYGKVISDIPKLYQIFKAMNEIKSNDDRNDRDVAFRKEDDQFENERNSSETKPILFI